MNVHKNARLTPRGREILISRLKRVLLGRGRVLVCGTCMDPRGLTEAALLDGASRSSMDGLAEQTRAADKVLVS